MEPSAVFAAVAPRMLPIDPDQDLLDQLDRRESGGLYFVAAVIGLFGAISGLLAYFTMVLELHTARELAFDSAVLVFIGSAVLLSTSYYHFR